MTYSSALWHPFSVLPDLDRDGPFVVTSGEGAWVTGENGRRYLDATAGLWYCNVGHGRHEIAEAVSRQMSTLASYSIFGDFATRPALELAERLATLAPVPESRVFLTGGGSDAIDTAIKLTRRYFSLIGQQERRYFIVREGAFHGMHVAASGLGGIDANVAGYGTLLPDVVRIDRDDPEALLEAVVSIGAERVAAFFCEPVEGAGGVHPPRPGYLERVRSICRDNGVLFVVDEVVTGFGRLGSWFASTRFNLQPDLVACAKGLSSGYVPVGALLIAPWIVEPFRSTGTMFRHGYTYSGHAASAAGALANLDIIEREHLLAAGARLETTLTHRLKVIEDLPIVSEVRRGVGAVAGVQIAPSRIDEDPTLPARAVRALRAAGILTRTLIGGAIQVSPSLVADDKEIDFLVAGLLDALTSLDVAPAVGLVDLREPSLRNPAPTFVQPRTSQPGWGSLGTKESNGGS